MVYSESLVNESKDIDLSSLDYTIDASNFVYVDDDAEPGWYDSTHVRTIREGIENASHYDTVFVYCGTYNESIIIFKKINLIGEKKEFTTIDGGERGNVVSILIDGVKIEGFKIINSNKKLLEIEDNSGIYINSNNCNISNNLIEENINGITIYGGENNAIYNNTFSKNKYRKIILFGSGIYVFQGKNNSIIKNSFYDNPAGMGISNSQDNIIEKNFLNRCGNGIELYGNYDDTAEEIKGNIVRKNTFISNRHGLIMSNSLSNKVYQNIFRENIRGAHVSDSLNNEIYDNNFILNIIPASFDADKLIHIKNRWDGNYWNRPRILPKVITGTFTTLIPGIGLIPIPLFNLDKNPAKNPYDI